MVHCRVRQLSCIHGTPLYPISRLPLRPLLRMAHMQTLPSLPLILLFRVTYLMNHHPYANTPMTHPSPLSHESGQREGSLGRKCS